MPQQLLDIDDVVDKSIEEDEDIVLPEEYLINSFGADYTVDSLVNRLQRGDIYIPSFQRDYVWSQKEASRFIESLLLGLPVPGIFLARESLTNKLIVIDGQQRLKTLQFYYTGEFKPDSSLTHSRKFQLQRVQKKFEGLTYSELDEKYRIRLDDSIIHATIVQQEFPRESTLDYSKHYSSSIYHIFERLNNGGLKLTPQEIRSAIFYGEFISMIEELNDYPAWRSIYGAYNGRMKDAELIIRFLALLNNLENYRRPMVEFLNEFAEKYRNADSEQLYHFRQQFTLTIDAASKALGYQIFRLNKSINAALFDSAMIGIHSAVTSPHYNSDTLKIQYAALLENTEYKNLIAQSTSDDNNVRKRIEIANSILSK